MPKAYYPHNVETELVDDTEFTPAAYSKRTSRMALIGMLLSLVCACCSLTAWALQRFVL